jgi:DtxR family Mn-dependent transcriptional regulator
MKKTKEKEHYVKLIFKLQEQQMSVSVSTLSQKLGVSKSSVTNMLKKLVQMELVDTAPYQPIALTEAGVAMAKVEVMGFSIDAVHPIAEEVEHIDSPVFFRRVKEMLKQDQTDPHGSSIPKIDF